MSIGSRIREARVSKGLNQEQLASAVNVTKGAISNYESDISSPRIDILYELMRVLGVDANYIFQDKMHHLSSYSLLPDEVHLVDAFRKADDRSRSDAIMILKAHQSAVETSETSMIETANKMRAKAIEQNSHKRDLSEAK